jgi:hypothetical protein
MNVTRKGVVAALLATLLATAAVAQEPAPIVRTHNPGLAATAALINIVYVPVRMMVITVGGFLGGFTGFITMGDKEAAAGIFGLFDGSAVVTPEMLEGVEKFRWSAYD